jgi:hypothetical protein
MKKLILTTLLFILVLQTVSIAYAWEIERPAYDIDIKERRENAYTNGEASVGIGVAIDDYDEGAADYGGDDYVTLNVSMTANSRMGIEYSWSWENLQWISESDLSNRSNITGLYDDKIFPIDIPQPTAFYFAFRFYGGYESAEYKRVYISTNDFISFDNTSGPNPTPGYIPSTAKPNAIIAAVWSDLKLDGGSSIITGLYFEHMQWYYVIMWKNVLHKSSGKRLTFEIILGNAPMWYPENLRFSQSQIWISYQNVSSINTDFTYGIEDQQGAKGLGGHLDGTALEDFNGKTIHFYQSSNSYFLKRLTLTFQDTNPNTTFDIREEDPNYTRGYHILLDTNKPSEPDPTYMFAKALAGTATLLINGWSLVSGVPVWVEAGGFILDVVLVTTDYMDLVDMLAYKQYSGIQINVFDMNDGLWQKANCTALTLDYAVDASLSVLVHWILKTPNDSGSHSLTITAIAEYYEQSITTGEIIPKNPISTSVNLKIGPDNNNTLTQHMKFQHASMIGFT